MILRFLIQKALKYSKKRILYNFLHNVCILLLIIGTFTIGDLNINSGNSSISFNIIGVIYLLIFAWIPFLIKPVCDYFFHVRQERYAYLSRGRQEIFNLTHVKCPKCKYTCETRWKTCPICKSPLTRKG